MKKNVSEIEVKEEVEEVSVFEEPPKIDSSQLEVEEAAEEENPYFTLGSWKGMPQWKCRFCPWDTLEGEGALMEHVVTVHGAGEPERRPGGILVADRYGNAVE